eukprot:1191313-Prorocentrum_minimum.AAC.1
MYSLLALASGALLQEEGELSAALRVRRCQRSAPVRLHREHSPRVVGRQVVLPGLCGPPRIHEVKERLQQHQDPLRTPSGPPQDPLQTPSRPRSQRAPATTSGPPQDPLRTPFRPPHVHEVKERLQQHQDPLRTPFRPPRVHEVKERLQQREGVHKVRERPPQHRPPSTIANIDHR